MRHANTARFLEFTVELVDNRHLHFPRKTMDYPVTPKGQEKMRAELRRLREVERPQNVRDLETAIGHGDLSENAEYDAAKNRQAMIAAQINDLSDKLARATVIDPRDIREDKIVFGATVTLEDGETAAQKIYQIVGEPESDIKAGLLSVASPVAKSLIGKFAGDTVVLRSSSGAREYEIISVEYR